MKGEERDREVGGRDKEAVAVAVAKCADDTEGQTCYQLRGLAMTELGRGLYDAKHHEDALSVFEAELSMERRHGGTDSNILSVQTNLSNAYHSLGRLEEALQMDRDIYSGRAKLNGEEDERTLRAASNYADSLMEFERFAEVKSFLQEVIPTVRRVFGDTNTTTLRMRWLYVLALYKDDSATLADVQEAVETLESVANSWKRVMGPAHPDTSNVQAALASAREALATRAAASDAA